MEKYKLKLLVNGYFIPGWVIASILSYPANKSILWAFVHAPCSWFYVAYWGCFKSDLTKVIAESLIR